MCFWDQYGHWDQLTGAVSPKFLVLQIPHELLIQRTLHRWTQCGNSLITKLWPSTGCSVLFRNKKRSVKSVLKMLCCTTLQPLQQEGYLIQRELAVSQRGQGDLMGTHQTKITGATGDLSRGSSGCGMKGSKKKRWWTSDPFHSSGTGFKPRHATINTGPTYVPDCYWISVENRQRKVVLQWGVSEKKVWAQQTKPGHSLWWYSAAFLVWPEHVNTPKTHQAITEKQQRDVNPTSCQLTRDLAAVRSTLQLLVEAWDWMAQEWGWLKIYVKRLYFHHTVLLTATLRGALAPFAQRAADFGCKFLDGWLLLPGSWTAT